MATIDHVSAVYQDAIARYRDELRELLEGPRTLENRRNIATLLRLIAEATQFITGMRR